MHAYHSRSRGTGSVQPDRPCANYITVVLTRHEVRAHIVSPCLPSDPSPTDSNVWAMPRFPVFGFVIAIASVFSASGPPADAALRTSFATKYAVATAKPTTTAKPKVPTAPVNVKADVEAKLTSLQQQASPTLKVGRATCPAAMAKVQVKAKATASKPAVFRCTVPVEGVFAPYDVEIRDGGYLKGGSFLMSRAKAIIDVAKVVAGTVAQLDADDRAKAKVRCGKAKVVVAAIGDKLTCTVDYGSSGVGTQTIAYEVKDLDGTIALVL